MKRRVDKRVNISKIYVFLWIIAFLVNLKGIFADFGPDQTYAMATSYRHLMGDRLFQEMWEPHQTSSFISDFGMWLYHLAVPSYEGVALFMQVYGVMLHALVTYVLYRVLKKYLSLDLVHPICLFFFVARPKLMVYPEFSNMHIAFSVLLLLCLVEFFQQEKEKYLILAAGCMCLLVLSYPSCVINFLGVVACLLIYAKRKWRSVCIFAGSCAVAGGIYGGYFLRKAGPGNLFENLRYIFTSDVSHTGTRMDPVVFLKGTVYGILWISVTALVALAICKWRRIHFLDTCMVLFMVSDIVLLYVAEYFHMDWTTIFFILHICIIGLGARNVKGLDRSERRMWVMGVLLSVCSAVSVLLLTNQEFLSVFAYMIPGVMVSLVPIGKAYQEAEIRKSTNRLGGGIAWPLVLFCLFVMLHRGIAVYGYINYQGKYVITGVENIVRMGPTKGIVTSLDKCNQSRHGMADWQTFTAPGQSVFMVEGFGYDPIVYLYNFSDVAAYSTIDTPVYNESLGIYWEKYEDKRPEVIAVKAWAGEEDWAKEGWLASFLETYYSENPEVGTYWHFYYRKH